MFIKNISLFAAAVVFLCISKVHAQDSIRFQLPYFVVSSDRDEFVEIVEAELNGFDFEYFSNGLLSGPNDFLLIDNFISSCGGALLTERSNEFKFLSEYFIFKHSDAWRAAVARIPPIVVDGNVVAAGIFGAPYLIVATAKFPHEDKDKFKLRVHPHKENIADILGYDSVKMEYLDFLYDLLESSLDSSLSPLVSATEISPSIFRRVIDQEYLDTNPYWDDKKSANAKKFLSKQNTELKYLDLFSHILITQHRFSHNSFCMSKSWAEGLSKNKYDILVKGLRDIATRWNLLIAEKANKQIDDSKKSRGLATFFYGNKPLSEAISDRQEERRELLAKQLGVESLYSLIR